MSDKHTMTYKIKIQGELQDLLEKTKTLKSSLEGIASGKDADFSRVFKQIEASLDKLASKTAAPLPVKAFDGLYHEVDVVRGEIEGLAEQITRLQSLSNAQKLELLPKEEQKRIADSRKALENFNKETEVATQSAEEYARAQKELLATQKKVVKLQEEMSKSSSMLESAKQQYEISKKENEILIAKTAALKAYIDAKKKEAKGESVDMEAAKKNAKNAGLSDADLDGKPIEQLAASYKILKMEQEQQEKTAKGLGNALASANKEYLRASNAVDAQKKSVEALTAQLAELEKGTQKSSPEKLQLAYTKLRNETEKLGNSLKEVGTEYSAENFEKLKAILMSCESEGLQRINETLSKSKAQTEAYSVAVNEASKRVHDLGEENRIADEKVQNARAFAERIKQFVGLRGAAMVARKALNNAMSTIKQLDATMTEMSVVTDLTVGDYWEQLPEYSKQASELGVSINDAYKAATLYYQQGLRSNEVTKISAETLKLAKIANLEAEDATNKMTAALRGFNMELNETSAQRVSDVYSELAAITAADVGEISNAMTKTASIAHSAGMEFETTAAFLSQIIETTRESAETAGTAMKTIIARFQELKKAPEEIGEVDGEIVDANKIETALRSVGVSLRDAHGQFRELDDVFLELSEKWGGLDKNTQRYIATIAAGSRQQSRFIAMMSDYGRTQELVTAANNSAGASQKQFEKTLDSLASKMEKLKNAWDTFTMDLLDSDVLKGAIDLLTKLLEGINELTEKLGDLKGLGVDGDISGTLKIGALVGGFALADKAITVFKASINDNKTIMQSFGAVGQSAIKSIQDKLVGITSTFNDVKARAMEARDVMAWEQSVGWTKKDSAPLKKEAGKDFSTELLKEYNKETQKQLQLQEQIKKAEKTKGKAEKEKTTLKRKDAIGRRDNVIAEQNKLIAESNIAVAESEKQKITLTKQYAAENGLTITQSKAALEIQAQGLVQDKVELSNGTALSASTVAQQAALGGLTTQKIADYKASMIAQGLNQDEINDRMAQITLTYAQAGAQVQENGTKKKGIALAFTNIGARLKEMTATLAQTIAQKIQNATMATGIAMMAVYGAVVLIVVAAVALLVIGIIALVKAFQNANKNSPEKRLEAAKKSLEAATEAAAEASEKFNSLNDAFDSLGDKYSALEELTEGTKEWQKAMSEINTEVADLITKYPELAGLVTSQDGVLTIDIDSEEAQEILRQYQMESVRAQSGVLMSKINVLQAEKDVAYQKMTTGESGKVIGHGLTTTNKGSLSDRQYLEIVSQAIAEGIIMQDEKGSWSVKNQDKFNELNITLEGIQDFSDAIGDNIQALKDYGRELSKREQQEKGLYQAIATQSLQGINLGNYSEQDRNQIVNYSKSNLAKNLIEKNDREIKNQYVNSGNREEYLEQLIKEQTGKTVEVTLNTNGVLAQDTYIVTDSEGNESEELSAFNLLEEYAAKDATSEMAEKLEKIPEAIDAFTKMFGNKTQGQIFEKMLSVENGGQLSLEDLALLWDSTSLLPMVEEFFKSNPELAEVFGSVDILYTTLWEIGNEAANYRNEVMVEKSRFGIEVDDTNLELQKGYLDKLNTIYLESGDMAVHAFNSQVQTLTKNLSPEQLERFYTQLNAFDWDDADSWTDFSNILYELGLNIPNDQMEDFINSAIRANNAIKQFNLDNFTDKIKKVGTVIKNIFEEEQDRTFSQEEYASLKNIAPELAEDFVENIDGTFTYIGESFTKITETINNALKKSRQTGEEQLRAKIEAANALFSVKEEESKYNVSNNGNWTDDEKREFVKRALEQFLSSGVDLTALGITGFGEETTVDTIAEMSTKGLEAVIEDLSKIGTDSLVWEKQLNTTIKQTNGLLAQFNSIQENADIAAEKRAAFSNIELDIVKEILDSNPEYLSQKEALEEAIANKDEETIRAIVSEIIEKEKLEDKVSEKKNESKTAILGQMGAIYTQALSKGISEEALSMYSEIISIIQNSSPDYDNFGAMMGIASEFESVLLEMVDAADAANEALNRFAMDFDYFEALDILKEDIDFREERLEKQHERQKKSIDYSADDLSSYFISRFELLTEEAKTLQAEQQSWMKVIGDTMTSGNNPFADFTVLDGSTGSYFIDYNAANAYIESIEDDTQKKQAQDMLSRHAQIFETFSNAYKNNLLALEDLVDEAAELFEYGQDEYYQLVDRIAEGLATINERAIEQLEEIDSTIEDTQSQLIEGIQQQINERRQERENQKTEEDLADKYSRAAYLRASSSGASGSDYFALQQDILETEENYQERLTDQALQAMQQASDDAAKQRNTQIDIARKQLESYKNSEQIFVDAEFLLLEAMTNSDKFSDSRAAEVIKSAEGFSNLNSHNQEAMIKELNDQGMVAALYGSSHDMVNQFLSAALDGRLTVSSGVLNLDENSINTGLDALSISFERLGTSIGDSESGLVGAADASGTGLRNMATEAGNAESSLSDVSEEGSYAEGALSNVTSSGTTAADKVKDLGTKSQTAEGQVGGLGDAASSVKKALGDEGLSGAISGASTTISGSATGFGEDMTKTGEDLADKAGKVSGKYDDISGSLGDINTAYGQIAGALGDTSKGSSIIGKLNTISNTLKGNTNSLYNTFDTVADEISKIAFEPNLTISSDKINTAVENGWKDSFDVLNKNIYESLGYTEVEEGVWKLTDNAFTLFQEELKTFFGLGVNEDGTTSNLITSVNTAVEGISDAFIDALENADFSDLVLSYGGNLPAGGVSANLTIPTEWSTYFSQQTTYLSQLVELVKALITEKAKKIDFDTQFAMQNVFAAQPVDFYYRDLEAWALDGNTERFSEKGQEVVGQIQTLYTKYVNDFDSYRRSGQIQGTAKSLSEFISTLTVQSDPALRRDDDNVETALRALNAILPSLGPEVANKLQSELGITDGEITIEEMQLLNGKTAGSYGFSSTDTGAKEINDFLSAVQNFNTLLAQLTPQDNVSGYHLYTPSTYFVENNPPETTKVEHSFNAPVKLTDAQRSCNKHKCKPQKKNTTAVEDLISKKNLEGRGEGKDLMPQLLAQGYTGQVYWGTDVVDFETARQNYLKSIREFEVQEDLLYFKGYTTLDEFIEANQDIGNDVQRKAFLKQAALYATTDARLSDLFTLVKENEKFRKVAKKSDTFFDNATGDLLRLYALGKEANSADLEDPVLSFLYKYSAGQVLETDLKYLANSEELQGILNKVMDVSNQDDKFTGQAIDAWKDINARISNGTLLEKGMKLSSITGEGDGETSFVEEIAVAESYASAAPTSQDYYDSLVPVSSAETVASLPRLGTASPAALRQQNSTALPVIKQVQWEEESWESNNTLTNTSGNEEKSEKMSIEEFTTFATSAILGSSALNSLGIAGPIATIVNILLGHLGVIQTISEILSIVFKPVLENLLKLVKFLFGYEEEDGRQVDGLLTPFFRVVENILKGIGSALEWVLAKFGKKDIDIDGDEKTAEDNKVTSLGEDAKNGWNAFTDGVEDAWNTTTTFVGNTWNAGTTLVGNVWNAGTTWVADKASDFAEGAKEIANSVADAATDAYRYGAEALQNVGDGIVDGFNSLLSRWGRSKDGSVAHYTGPMWIDGTPSCPEMILNPQQTQDMLAVVEYLNSKDGEALNNYPQLRRLGKTIPKLKQYKTGGRVNTTGLAWLDGTRRRPEYVLNSKQTQDFFDLQKFIAERKNKALSRPQNIPKKQESNIFATLKETLATETLADFFYDKLGSLINAFKPSRFDDQLKNSAVLDNAFQFDLSSMGSIFRKSPNQNFSIQDLSSRINAKMEGSPMRGDNYFDIDINVENISDDYDIEQIADKIRSMLYEDAAFRNVRALMN